MGDLGRLLILGLGNVLLRDDGLGIAALETLRTRYSIPDDVHLVDGGTLGLALLAELTSAEDVILVDAVMATAPPGTLVRIEGDQVPQAAYERLSTHQVGVADLLAAAELIGRYPRRVVLLGLVPDSLELALGCSSAVNAGLPVLASAIADECSRLGRPLTEAA